MRFIADGPAVPDDLLTARDEGRVIFFCGAGVSRARAHLPDFFGLAEKVVSTLGVSSNEPARKLINEAKEIDARLGTPGIISADRVFGLLERKFATRDLEEAVATALEPARDCDISAHRILLDLATTPEGRIQLVTTNFDRLFECCDRKFETWQPPRLPDPLRSTEMNGVVYLHGRCQPNYRGAEGDGFVLSSSEFGRAYLADGWATAFFRKLIERFFIVFVGYAADDPPVQYLLEALHKTTGRLPGVYAFQSGDSAEASSRWLHKGVEAISYDPAHRHRSLWLTLEAWAERAKNPEQWFASAIQRAISGPKALRPHERGQIAHIVSTPDGARRFCSGESPPSAEWLCVLDPACRYRKPGTTGKFGQRGPFVDPFDIFGLDTDIRPNAINPDDSYAKREMPSDAWSAFSLTRLDRHSLRDDNLSAMSGHWARNVPRLPPRIAHLASWIAKVSHQPATVWWAAKQYCLHPDLQKQIAWELERSDKKSDPEIRKAWRFLFETWKHDRSDFHDAWFDFRSSVNRDGWSSSAVRRFAEVRRPFVSSSMDVGGPIPIDSDEIQFRDLVHPDVEYPDHPIDLDIPDQWLSGIVEGLRKNLELAVKLELEIGGYGLSNLVSIVPEDDPEGDLFGRTHGPSGALIEFAHWFHRLSSLDKASARAEHAAWPSADNHSFAKLRMWALGLEDLVLSSAFYSELEKIPNEAFWYSHHQRDILLALHARWHDLDANSREAVERQLLSGPPRWRDEEPDHFARRRAATILDRLVWLDAKGCKLSFDLTKTVDDLHQHAPDWRSADAEDAAKSLGPRGGWVKTVTDHAELVAVPLADVLTVAKAARDNRGNFLQRNDPFAGLSKDRPAHALKALAILARRGEYPTWAWETFLGADARSKDNLRIIGVICERLVRCPSEELKALVRVAADWLSVAGKLLATSYPQKFRTLVRRLVAVLLTQPTIGNSALIRTGGAVDWNTEAINSAPGKIAEALFEDPLSSNLKKGTGFPSVWLEDVELLLSLPGNLRSYALVIFCHNLNWFHLIEPKWTENHLVYALRSNNKDERNAAWSGFLHAARVPNRDLYLMIKEMLIEHAGSASALSEEYEEITAGLLLAGWTTLSPSDHPPAISNQEMRDIILAGSDDFRMSILRQIERWARQEYSTGSQSEWARQLLILLREVWPRQIAVKSPRTSARILQAILISAELFPQLTEAALPLLTKVDHDRVSLLGFREHGDDREDLAKKFPRHYLELLTVVLGDSASSWPYGIESIFPRLVEGDPAIVGDERYISLKRIWDAR